MSINGLINNKHILDIFLYTFVIKMANKYSNFIKKSHAVCGKFKDAEKLRKLYK